MQVLPPLSRSTESEALAVGPATWVSPSHPDVRMHPNADATVSYDGENQAQKLNNRRLNSVSASY